jgi:hypothetical protein
MCLHSYEDSATSQIPVLNSLGAGSFTRSVKSKENYQLLFTGLNMGSSYRKSGMVFVQRVWVYRNHWKKEEEEEEKKRKNERSFQFSSC